MIIDCHTHLMSSNFMSQAFWDNWIKVFSFTSGRPQEVIRKRLPEFWDETGELLIKDMDAAGIAQSWISVLDYGLFARFGEGKYSITELNRIYAQVAQTSNNRLIAFASVDPRREEAVELFERCIKEWGMKGLKLLPACGFYPNDENCYELYSKAEELGVPVLVHTGPEGVPLYSKYCYPVYLDDVANDFPNLTLILAHAGFCWWREALNIATLQPNMYLDIAGWQPRTLRHPLAEFYAPLRIILDTMGSSRILFGSDWPALRLFRGGQPNWVKVFKEPPNTLREAGIHFTKEEIDAILGGNAFRLIPTTRKT